MDEQPPHTRTPHPEERGGTSKPGTARVTGVILHPRLSILTTDWPSPPGASKVEVIPQLKKHRHELFKVDTQMNSRSNAMQMPDGQSKIALSGIVASPYLASLETSQERNENEMKL